MLRAERQHLGAIREAIDAAAECTNKPRQKIGKRCIGFASEVLPEWIRPPLRQAE